MSGPSTSTRLDDGHPTLISLAMGAGLWEKGVTPPGMDGGGANDTTTMHNAQWRTNAPKHLRTLTDTSFNAAYSVVGLGSLVGIINNNQEITITFGDGSTCTFWGWLNAFAPGELTEGAQPTASCTIVASNQDTDHEEVAPEYTDEGGGYNPLIHTYQYITAKQLELYQRIREGRENPKLFSKENLPSGAASLGLYDSFDIGDVRQKIRDFAMV
jgi:hypothetical protein